MHRLKPLPKNFTNTLTATLHVCWAPSSWECSIAGSEQTTVEENAWLIYIYRSERPLFSFLKPIAETFYQLIVSVSCKLENMTPPLDLHWALWAVMRIWHLHWSSKHYTTKLHPAGISGSQYYLLLQIDLTALRLRKYFENTFLGENKGDGKANSVSR